jgi:beta-phosphoglucomutase-like phosphatase (HAD superfamily)
LQPIEAVFFEPVGCLAEFAPEEFEAIAGRVFGRPLSAGLSGSDAYWDLLALFDAQSESLSGAQRAIAEHCEIEAVARSHVYEDVGPALAELHALGVRLVAASSLSAAAVARFLEKCSLDRPFDDVWSRDAAGGVKRAPLVRALGSAALAPDRVLFLTDTAEGLRTAEEAGVNPILMMNDPDQAMKLTALGPAGGIVSLHELPDFVRLVSAEHAR